MNYLGFYDLEQEAFSNAPVGRFYFHSDQHTQALLRLERIVRQMKGLAVLIGGIGAGKTTLARKLLESLPESEFEAALLVIIHSGITPDWLLKRIAQQLGVAQPAEGKLALLSQLYRRLLQIADSGKKAVVLIDETQMLQTRELMEEFRGLLNLEIPGRKLITFVFFGLPELEENLKLDLPLAQRVALKYHLDAFDSTSCYRYIDHRLKLAGATREIFEDAAKEAIFNYSRGIPRVINTIADNALFEGYLLKASTIGSEIIENIAVDLGLSLSPKRESKGFDLSLAQVSVKEQEDVFVNLFESPENAIREGGLMEQSFEREESRDSEDINSILAGLEEKL